MSGLKRSELPKLANSVKGFQSSQVTTVTRKAGQGVLITYLADSKANPVTGKTLAIPWTYLGGVTALASGSVLAAGAMTLRALRRPAIEELREL